MGSPAPNTGSAGGPDLETLWNSFSQWTVEAGERYRRDVANLERMPGLSAEGRTTEIGKREQAYQDEMMGLREGPTWQALKGSFETVRKQYQEMPWNPRAGTESGFARQRQAYLEAESPEAFYESQFGSYKAPGSEQDAAGPASAMASETRQPGAEGTDAAVAGLGPRRPWWAL